MPKSVDYNLFINDTGYWPNSPSSYVEYAQLVTGINDLKEDDRIITFNNLPQGVTVADSSATTFPVDSIFIDGDFTGFLTYNPNYIYFSSLPLYLQSFNGTWTGFLYDTVNESQVNGYLYYNQNQSLSGFWIFETGGSFLYFKIDGSKTPPQINYNPWELNMENINIWPNENLIQYEKIDNFSIKILDNINEIPRSLRKVFINFNKP